MIAHPAPAQELIDSKLQRPAWLWHVARRDGTSYYLTSHNNTISFEGNTYTPIGGMEVSAARRGLGLRGQDRTSLGLITTDTIKDEDLWAGLFDMATVNEYKVDWKYPWAGAWSHLRYWITNIRFNSLIWESDMVSIASWLQQKIGARHGLTCRTDLGSTKCGVNLAAYTQTNAVVDVPTSKEEFNATTGSIVGVTDGYYVDGTVEWKTGNNVGTTSIVKEYTHSTRTFKFYQSTPQAIQAGDTFDATRGCNKQLGWEDTTGDCVNTFLNHLNFRGEPWLPNSDKLIQTPPV